ncbi:MAG: AAA family ATPase [Helicobacteraceae bacterium]|nr:AAA family ATPase [Helicobacteraceae bacterium]
MQLRQVKIINYKNFENVVIDFEKSNFPDIFSIASKNGGGKSTLLQFIFILLHCLMDEYKKQYIQNLLKTFSNITKDIDLVKFIIEHDEEIYNLDFSIVKSKSQNMNFNLYLDIKDTKIKITKYQENINEFREVLELKQALEETNRITPVIERNIRFLRKHISTKQEEILLRNVERSDDVEGYKKIVDLIISKNSLSENTLNELEEIYNNVQINLNNFEEELSESNLKYITHLKEHKNVLLLKTKMSNELLNILTNKIFLTAPSSQIFLFLSDDEKYNIFSEFSTEKDTYNNRHYNNSTSYYDSVKRAKRLLGGFFTYDFASTELILKSFKKASEDDLKEKRKTGTYGSKYDELTNELKDFLDGKEITENEDGNKVIFKSKNNRQELAPEDLSHGELKKLGIYIWLKYIVEENSIILMDEVDIALHPKWQYELIKDLITWSKDSQFLLATHSPQILSSTYYKNLIKLESGEVKRFNKPPLDRDINAIITQIMEAPDFPEDLKELHIKYRKCINDGKAETPKAKKLKEEILEYESENSSFFQEINFDLELI